MVLLLVRQGAKDSLITKLLSADKVEILSHQDLHLRSTFEEMKMGINGYWRSIVDSNGLNECIVIKKVVLSKMKIVTLIKVLSTVYSNEITVDKNSCFLPHEAIVLYFKGKCSFIDICFDCRRFSSSKDLIFPDSFLLTDSNWTELRDFFIANGVDYKIVLKQ